MSGRIKSLQDLMEATYEGNYALQWLKGGNLMNGAKAGGMHQPLGSLPNANLGKNIPQGDLLKADDPLYTTDTSYFNAIYGKTVMDWLNHESDVWKLLRKTTYQSEGDSIRVVSADASNFYGQLETATALGDTDIPDLTEVTFTDPAVMYNHWNSSLIAQLKSTWQDSPGKNAAQWLKQYFLEKHPSDINVWLCKDADTPAASGGNFDNYIESIDRVCSASGESSLLSAATDNDIYGFDRSAGEAEAYVDLNSGTLRDLDLGLIDDMIADCKKYSKAKRFILLTDETQLNTLEALEATKTRYTDHKYKIDTVNGVNTRQGIAAGFSIATYRGAGLEIPIFTSKDIHAESGGNGNIYLLDLDHIEIRVALPSVYLSTENQHFLLLDNFSYKSMIVTVAQLVADKFNCHGAIKYLN